MQDLKELTALFAALSDPTRLRIVRLLAVSGGELCVCELVDCLEEPQYHISRHLRELRDSGLVRSERDGRWVYYSLNPAQPLALRLAELTVSLQNPVFENDERNFHRRMQLRVGGRCRIGIQQATLASPSPDSFLTSFQADATPSAVPGSASLREAAH